MHRDFTDFADYGFATACGHSSSISFAELLAHRWRCVELFVKDT
jgi:hypothetical protein